MMSRTCVLGQDPQDTPGEVHLALQEGVDLLLQVPLEQGRGNRGMRKGLVG